MTNPHMLYDGGAWQLWLFAPMPPCTGLGSLWLYRMGDEPPVFLCCVTGDEDLDRTIRAVSTAHEIYPGKPAVDERGCEAHSDTALRADVELAVRLQGLLERVLARIEQAMGDRGVDDLGTWIRDHEADHVVRMLLDRRSD